MSLWKRLAAVPAWTNGEASLKESEQTLITDLDSKWMQLCPEAGLSCALQTFWPIAA